MSSRINWLAVARHRHRVSVQRRGLIAHDYLQVPGRTCAGIQQPSGARRPTGHRPQATYRGLPPPFQPAVKHPFAPPTHGQQVPYIYRSTGGLGVRTGWWVCRPSSPSLHPSLGLDLSSQQNGGLSLLGLTLHWPEAPAPASHLVSVHPWYSLAKANRPAAKTERPVLFPPQSPLLLFPSRTSKKNASTTRGAHVSFCSETLYMLPCPPLIHALFQIPIHVANRQESAPARFMHVQGTFQKEDFLFFLLRFQPPISVAKLNPFPNGQRPAYIGRSYAVSHI